MGAPAIPEETTTAEESAEVAPPEEPTAEATDEPAVMGAPAIPEEATAAEESAEVAPENSADEISGADQSVDGSGSAEVAEGDTGNLVEEEPTEASKL
jgi:hypothetical protein